MIDKEAFEKRQEAVKGYVQYKIRGKPNDLCVDSYTRQGLCIKTVLARASEDVVEEWLKDKCTF